jgi:hypothetical protein
MFGAAGIDSCWLADQPECPCDFTGAKHSFSTGLVNQMHLVVALDGIKRLFLSSQTG